MINEFCKKPLWECNETLVRVALGQQPADLVIRDARLVSVTTHEILEHADITIADAKDDFATSPGDLFRLSRVEKPGAPFVDPDAPVQARKMAAKMEGMGYKDVWFYENTEGGHGAGADNAQAATMHALAYDFLWDKLQ